MLKLFEDFDLIAHHFDILFLLSLLFDGLDGHELPCELAPCLVDVSVGALSDQRDDVVVLLLVFTHIIIQIWDIKGSMVG